VNTFRDLVRAVGATVGAAGLEAVKLTLREREAKKRERKLAIKREVTRLNLLLGRIKKELKRDESEALDLCCAEINKWGEPGDGTEDWKDSPEVVELRHEIMDLVEDLLPEEEDPDGEDEWGDDEEDGSFFEDDEEE
jgi:hypothetical protein